MFRNRLILMSRAGQSGAYNALKAKRFETVVKQINHKTFSC